MAGGDSLIRMTPLARLFRFDSDLLSLGLFQPAKGNGQDAVLEVSINFLLVEAFGKRDEPMEGTVARLPIRVVVSMLFLLGLLLPLNREAIVGKIHLDFL